MILDPATVDRDLRLEAEVCIVGSGVGGAVVAAEVAAAGRSVVVLEEGRYWTSRDFTQREEEMYPRLYRERGTKPTADYAVLVSQGRALGGSSIASYCLCFRTPHQILDHWQEEHDVAGPTHEELFPHFERVERAIGVRTMGPEHLNANNAILRRGAERLGLRGRFLDHNRTDCLGCGFCALGCAYDRKGDSLTTHLAEASRAGARLLPQVRVDRVRHERGRATGVEGHLRSKLGRRHAVSVTAPVVVVAAGALESPVLWLRSELPDRGGAVGENLRLQPHLVVSGLFAETVEAWNGVPHSWVVDEYLNLDKKIEGGFLAFAASAQPITTASLLPGVGADHRRLMRSYARMASIAVFLHDRAAGRVSADSRGQTTVEYQLDDDDEADVMEAIRRAADILFAAGATSVVLPYNDRVQIRSRAEASIVEERGILANDPLLFSLQPQGTLRMSSGPRYGVVDAFGRAWGVAGLYVADASVFPTSVAVPPQITVMAFASRTASAILSDGPRPRAA